MDINEFEQDLEKAAKTASEWLMAETRSILQEKGRFKSTEHTKSLYSIMAEELDKMGYCKKEEVVRAVLTEELDLAEETIEGLKAVKASYVKDIIEKTEKMTAKEILILAEDYNCGEKDDIDNFMLALKERYGVEVE